MVQFSLVVLYVMEWDTPLPKTWPTFLMKVLTCMGMQILRHSTAHIAILWISLLLETWASLQTLSADYHNSTEVIQPPKTDILFFARRLKEANVKLKPPSPAKLQFLLPDNANVTDLKNFVFLAFITIWRRSGIALLSPAFSRNKTAYFF